MKGTSATCIALLLSAAMTAQQPKIVGGSDAAEGQFPWMACMYLLGEPACGGVLIHPEWVLTAAHCVFDEDMSIFSFRLNSVNAWGDLNPDGGVEVAVSEVIIHPEYNFIDQVGQYVDLALFHLAEPVTSITPIALPMAQDAGNLYESWSAVNIAGWGLIVDGEGNTSIPEILQWVVSNVYDFDMCESSFGHSISDDFFCVGYTAGQGASGAATGDSGGPAWVYDNEGNEVLTGIVHGALWDYTALDEPGVFVKVAHQLTWIDEVINGVTSAPAAETPKPAFSITAARDGFNFVTHNYEGAMDLALYTMQGSAVMNKTIYSNRENVPVQLSHLPSGLYILRGTTASGYAFSAKVAWVR